MYFSYRYYFYQFDSYFKGQKLLTLHVKNYTGQKWCSLND